MVLFREVGGCFRLGMEERAKQTAACKRLCSAANRNVVETFHSTGGCCQIGRQKQVSKSMGKTPPASKCHFGTWTRKLYLCCLTISQLPRWVRPPFFWGVIILPPQNMALWEGNLSKSLHCLIPSKGFCFNDPCMNPRKLQHTPRPHPRQSPVRQL